MPYRFELYIAKANELVNELAAELGFPTEKERTVRILRAVLHGLRDNMPVQESLQLLSQLPMIVKALYVDGWSLKKNRRKARKKQEFIEDVISHDPKTVEHDFTMSSDSVGSIISVTLRVLGRYISEGEKKDIVAVMPSGLRPYIEESFRPRPVLISV